MHPFSPKARRFIQRRPEEDKRYNILVGSVRSGKTWTMMAKLLFQLNRYKVAGLRVIVGQSKQTVLDNVLRDLFEFVGPKAYRYNAQSGELTLYGVLWLVIGAGDEGAVRYITGKTIGLAYIDEAVLIPKSFWDMLLSRMSPTGARLYATTNPGPPTHYLKTDVIDNPDLASRVWVENFYLSDNLSLDAETRYIFEHQFTGVFRKRYIEALWVAAEGSIFGDAWDDSRNLYESSTRPIGLLGQGGHRARYISIDYGTTNATAFLDVFDDGRTLWIDREYYYDSRKLKKQLTDSQYADAFEQFAKAHPTRPEIILDPAAASFRVELQNRGYRVTNADNDVMDGIRQTSSMLLRGLIRINKDGCPTWPQLLSYGWDEKGFQARRRGPRQDRRPLGRRSTIRGQNKDFTTAADGCLESNHAKAENYSIRHGSSC
jgi:PBSX family phage terminase large subunit